MSINHSTSHLVPQPVTAVVLMNLGTPDEPTPSAVRRYLREFLSDQRVIELPKWLWQIILNVFVLTTRPKKVAHGYQSVWQEDSPIRAILQAQTEKLSQMVGARAKVVMATTYGNPNIRDVLWQLGQESVDNIIVLPLYPQYSATSTGAAFDAVARSLMKMRDVPSMHFIKDYHNHPLYIQALDKSVRNFWAKHGRADKLLMSFHGIPKPYVDKGDPYAKQCHTTAKLLADALGLADDEWHICFQSRFGAQEWVKPYTDVLLQELGQQGVESVQIMSPAFSADCLETLEELAVENRDNFLSAGGKKYAYIPALNADDVHIQLMYALVEPYLS